ncbi:FxLD family lanthipeptide [Streptomyces sp. NPDC020965]|uniref:FxLD family lanthipeptide n=1 Tax=Streptomyces sp. NPDC020965 TaxID=3365105 RepID=UPI0037A7DD0D
MTTALLDSLTAAVEPPAGELSDDDFQLDIRVVVAESPVYNFNCPTSDGCGNTCANGASSCVSSIEDAS